MTYCSTSGKIAGFPNHFLMRKPDHPAENREASFAHTRSLQDDERVRNKIKQTQIETPLTRLITLTTVSLKVLWAQQLFHKSRVKRGGFVSEPAEIDRDREARIRMKRSIVDDKEGQLMEMVRRVAGLAEMERGIPPKLLQLWDEEEEASQNEEAPPRPKNHYFNDELWDHQWYMVRDRQE